MFRLENIRQKHKENMIYFLVFKSTLISLRFQPSMILQDLFGTKNLILDFKPTLPRDELISSSATFGPSVYFLVFLTLRPDLWWNCLNPELWLVFPDRIIQTS